MTYSPPCSFTQSYWPSSVVAPDLAGVYQLVLGAQVFPIIKSKGDYQTIP